MARAAKSRGQWPGAIRPSWHRCDSARCDDWYEVVFTGETADGKRLRASVRGDRDPGYGSTAKMITESALCLATDTRRALSGGGVWTAGSAMGMALLPRLQQRAGLTFAIED